MQYFPIFPKVFDTRFNPPPLPPVLPPRFSLSIFFVQYGAYAFKSLQYIYSLPREIFIPFKLGIFASPVENLLPSLSPENLWKFVIFPRWDR